MGSAYRSYSSDSVGSKRQHQRRPQNQRAVDDVRGVDNGMETGEDDERPERRLRADEKHQQHRRP